MIMDLNIYRATVFVAAVMLAISALSQMGQQAVLSAEAATTDIEIECRLLGCFDSEGNRIALHASTDA